MIAVVPKNGVDHWKKNYETFCDWVVPESTKYFNYEDKDA